MHPEFTNVDLSRIDVFVLSLVPAFINIAIYFYVILTFHKTRTNLFFSLFVLLIGLWQTSEGLMRMSVTRETADAWFKISEIFLVFGSSFGIQFIIKLIKQHKKLKTDLVSHILLIISLFFFFVIEGGYEKHSIEISSKWYWIGNPEPNLMTNILLTWISIAGLSMITLLWYYYVTNRDKALIRKQALLLFISLTAPVLTGIIAEIIFPVVLNYDDIPLTTSMVTVFSISALIAINKYKMLDYSPKHQWEQIVTTLNDAILIVNNDDTVMYANDSFCKLLGYKFEEILGKNASDLFLFPDQKKEMSKIIEERKNKKAGTYEVPMLTKNKETIWVMISGSPYTDHKGKIIGSIGVHTNITQLKSINKELETFIYKASHDLRGPLASIIGLVSVSKLEGNKESSLKYLDMIETASRKLDSTLSELVKAMKIKEATKFNDPINFEELVNDILNRFTYYPGYSNLKVSVDISILIPFVSSKQIIETILQNLIENAIKYQNPEPKDNILKILIRQVDQQVEIQIEDNGIGIEEEAISRVFDMYFRGTKTSKGSGLGLYLVKNAIDKLGGKIEVSSIPDSYSNFKIMLPFNR